MKKYALTIIAASIVTAHSAMADVTLYGKANVSIQTVKEKTADGDFTAQSNVELNSNKSRFGVKGEEALNDTLKAMYQMEWEVALDNGDTGSGHAIKQRNTFVGLGGKWGSVLVGINDTPVKMLDKPIDLFSDLKYADIDNTTVGEVRLKNSLMYRSPIMSGFNVDIMISPGEDKGSDSLSHSASKNKRNGVADGISAAVAYQLGGFKFALGMDNKIEHKLAMGSIDGIAGADIGSKAEYSAETDLGRVVVSYDSAVFGVAGMVQRAKQSNGEADSLTLTYDPALVAAAQVTKFGSTEVESLDTVSLAGYYVVDGVKLKALVQDTAFDVSDLKLQQMVLGADYKLAKNTMLFSYIAHVNGKVDGTELASNNTLGLGIEHNF